jgi:hypothetical protein
MNFWVSWKAENCLISESPLASQRHPCSLSSLKCCYWFVISFWIICAQVPNNWRPCSPSGVHGAKLSKALPGFPPYKCGISLSPTRRDAPYSGAASQALLLVSYFHWAVDTWRNFMLNRQLHLLPLIRSNRVRECVIAVLLGASWLNGKRILWLCFASQYN